MTDDSLAKFDAPPLIEVVFGARFREHIPGFRLPHYGLFWETIRDEFPRFQHAPFLTSPDKADVIEGDFVPLRLWCINKDDDQLIQLQSNRFLFNWRKRSNEYPSYDKVSPRFFAHLATFVEFLNKQSIDRPIVDQLELTYISHVPAKSNEWIKDVGSVNNIFPDYVPIEKNTASRGLISGINSRVVYALSQPQGAELHIHLRTAATLPQNESVFVLELKVIGPPENEVLGDSVLDAWFNDAHAAIVRTFEDMTDPEVQTHWWKKQT